MDNKHRIFKCLDSCTRVLSDVCFFSCRCRRRRHAGRRRRRAGRRRRRAGRRRRRAGRAGITGITPPRWDIDARVMEGGRTASFAGLGPVVCLQL